MSAENDIPEEATITGDRHAYAGEPMRAPTHWWLLALVFALVVAGVGGALWLARARLRAALIENMHAHEVNADVPRPQAPPGRKFPEEPIVKAATRLESTPAPMASPSAKTNTDIVPLPAGPVPLGLPTGTLSSAGPAGRASAFYAGPPAGTAGRAGNPDSKASSGQSSMMVDPTPYAPGAATVTPEGEAQWAGKGASTPPDGRGGGGQSPAAFTGTRIADAFASLLGPRDLLLARGSVVPCVLETQLISNIAGLTSCIVTENIYSDDGHTLLIERGSRVSGEYQSSAKNGDSSLFVLWNRIKTPLGVIVTLDSPGGDAVGGQGLPGIVDNHWWERIGAAFLLSVFQDAVAVEIARQGARGGGTVTTINTTPSNTVDAAQDLSKGLLKETVNIPPTLYKNRGELLTIYVARDLWFDHVYRIR